MLLVLVYIRAQVRVALCCSFSAPVLRIGRDVVNSPFLFPARDCPFGEVFSHHLFFPYFSGHIVLALVSRYPPSIFLLFLVSPMLSLVSRCVAEIFSLCVRHFLFLLSALAYGPIMLRVAFSFYRFPLLRLRLFLSVHRHQCAICSCVVCMSCSVSL